MCRDEMLLNVCVNVCEVWSYNLVALVPLVERETGFSTDFYRLMMWDGLLESVRERQRVWG